METSFLPRILAFLVLMCLSAFFSASEVALFSLRQARIEHLKAKGVAAARLISELLARPRRLLISILIGNETVNLAASSIVASLVIVWLGEGYKWLAVVIMTPLLMLFGEITPKAIALRRSEAVARWVARPIAVFSVVVTPLRWIFRRASDWIIRSLGGGHPAPDNILSLDEFRTLVDMGHQEGALEDQERALIHSVFEFGDTLVSEIMVPRPDIFLLSYHLEIPQILETVRKNPHSRIPVYRTHPGNVVGILHTKDLLPLVRGVPGPKAGQRLPLREPYFVPPSKKVSDLFHDFNRKKTHIALVVDEFGDLSGLVTLEDVLAELFGELTVSSEGDYLPLEEGGYLISARMPVHEVEEKMGFQLPKTPAETLGGFVMDLLGRVPEPGERIARDGLVFTVAEMRGRRILKVRVDLPRESEKPE
ncbi:MAG: HlyC/CorC family transporter [Candidatus Tectomicrobia bacterium]|nr:HlyC/CorC family transporter [Candidatus Tectomicrobia bacterium]